jgi:hypothetical protein
MWIVVTKVTIAQQINNAPDALDVLKAFLPKRTFSEFSSLVNFWKAFPYIIRTNPTEEISSRLCKCQKNGPHTKNVQ